MNNYPLRTPKFPSHIINFIRFIKWGYLLFFFLLLADILILIFIHDQLKFHNGVGQNMVSKWYLIFVITIAALFWLTTLCSLLITALLLAKMREIRRYLNQHGKEETATITSKKSVIGYGNRIPLRIIDFGLELTSCNTHALKYYPSLRGIPDINSKVQVLYDPKNTELAIIK